MIKIDFTKTLKKEIQDAHWKYFESKGFRILEEKVKSEEDALRKELYTLLFDEGNAHALLSKIILGDEKEHREVIEKVNGIIKREFGDYDVLMMEGILDKAKKLLPTQESCIGETLESKKEILRQCGSLLPEFSDIIDNYEPITLVKQAKQIVKEIRDKRKELVEQHKNKKIELAALRKRLLQYKTYKDGDDIDATDEEKKNKKYKTDLEKIFNYDSFSKVKSVNDWGGYQLTQKLGLTTCPYCNRLYTNTLVNKDKAGKTRPSLDHFLPKSEYPYLALSLYNLIPSCQVCNSSFKGSIDFYKEEHLNPHEAGFGKDAIFRTDLMADADGNYSLDHLHGAGGLDGFELQLRIDESSPDAEKIKKNNQTFHLEELYRFHKDYVLEIIKKTIFYNKNKIDELISKNVYPGLFDSRGEVIRTLIGNYVEEKNLGKRVLAKLTKDIWEEFRLEEVWNIKL